jgi:hypothetical protein
MTASRDPRILDRKPGLPLEDPAELLANLQRTDIKEIFNNITVNQRRIHSIDDAVESIKRAAIARSKHSRPTHG